MFRHYNIADHIEEVSAAKLFEDRQKEIPGLWRSKEGLASETATRDVMQVTTTVV
jgi:hypothetical protein